MPQDTQSWEIKVHLTPGSPSLLTLGRAAGPMGELSSVG